MDSNASNEETYSTLITNQSYDVLPNDLSANDQIDYQRKSSSAAAASGIDANDVRSEALIKKIHPFVYPKQFNTIEGIAPPNRGFNVTNEHLIEIRDELDNLNNQRLDETLTPPDQKKTASDLLPWSTHLFERQPPAKHASQHFHYGFIDRPIAPLQQQPNLQNQSILPNANNCLLGLLHGCDPLVLLGILGFLAYVINSILSLVNRINLPLSPLLTTTSTAAEMTTVNNAASTTGAATKASIIPYPIGDESAIESNQKLLKDFERILQMAIEVYEQKVNSI